MNTQELQHLFEKHDKEYAHFERVENPLSKRSDIHAFLLLDKLCQDDKNIIDGAKDDVIYLKIKVEKLATEIKEEQIIELLRCGVSHYEDGNLVIFRNKKF